MVLVAESSLRYFPALIELTNLPDETPAPRVVILAPPAELTHRNAPIERNQECINRPEIPVADFELKLFGSGFEKGTPERFLLVLEDIETSGPSGEMIVTVKQPTSGQL